jgi:hypothetical protein
MCESAGESEREGKGDERVQKEGTCVPGRQERRRRGKRDLPCSLSASARASISRDSASPALSFSTMRRANTQLFIKAMISSCFSFRSETILASIRPWRRRVYAHACMRPELTLIKLRVASNLIIKWNNDAGLAIERARGIPQNSGDWARPTFVTVRGAS